MCLTRAVAAVVAGAPPALTQDSVQLLRRVPLLAGARDPGRGRGVSLTRIWRQMNNADAYLIHDWFAVSSGALRKIN